MDNVNNKRIESVTVKLPSSPPQTITDPTDERVLSTLLQWVTNTPGASISIYHATDGAWSYSAYKIGTQKEESKNE